MASSSGSPSRSIVRVPKHARASAKAKQLPIVALMVDYRETDIDSRRIELVGPVSRELASKVLALIQEMVGQV